MQNKINNGSKIGKWGGKEGEEKEEEELGKGKKHFGVNLIIYTHRT